MRIDPFSGRRCGDHQLRRLAEQIQNELQAGVAEVRDYQLYVGTASPMDFNGMVRHYFLRTGQLGHHPGPDILGPGLGDHLRHPYLDGLITSTPVMLYGNFAEISRKIPKFFQKMLDQQLQPGVWLRKRTIAAKLNMSTTPLVEAFRRLEQEGLLEVVPQWGVRVRALTVDELEQVFLMRIALEKIVFRRLAEQASQLEWKLESLRATAAELDAKIQADVDDPDPIKHKPGCVNRDDSRFHMSLVELSELNIVTREINRLWLLPATAQRFTGQDTLEVTHVELLDAIVSGNADAAELAIHNHIDRKLRGALPILRERFGDGPIMFEQ